MQSYRAYFLQNSFLRSYIDSGLSNKIDLTKEAVPGGVATLGADGILTPSQRPPASGGGNSSLIIWQPGATSPQAGVYSDWPSVYSKIQTIPGIKTVIIDSSLAVCEIPSGTYDLSGVIFFGKKIFDSFFGSTTAQLLIDAGVVFADPPEEIRRLKVQFSPLSGTPVYTTAGTVSLKIVDSQILNGGTGNVFLIPATTTLCLLLENSSIDKVTSSNAPVFNIAGTLVIYGLSGQVTIGNDSFTGAGVLAEIISGAWNNYTSGHLWGTLPSFTGLNSFLNLRSGNLVSYDNSIGGNQNITSSNISSVIREINPKQTGRLNVKGSLLTNDGSGNLIGIPPGTNGKIPIYDSSVTGGIRTDFYTGQDEFNVGTVTGATVIDFKNGISQKIILGANGISVSFLNMQPGRLYQLFVVQDSVGGRSSISFSNLHWQNDTVPVLTTTPNYGNLLELYSTGSSLLALNKGIFNGT